MKPEFDKSRMIDAYPNRLTFSEFNLLGPDRKSYGISDIPDDLSDAQRLSILKNFMSSDPEDFKKLRKKLYGI